MRPRDPRPERRGFTLVELLLAMGLFSLLLVVLMRLLDTTLGTLRSAGEERERFVRESALFEFVARDLGLLASGAASDLLLSTRRFDVDGDGVAGRPWQRLVFVRQVPPGERPGSGAGADLGRSLGLAEVCWTVLPRAVPRRVEGAPGRRGDGVLVRLERALEDGGLSLFDAQAFGPGGLPRQAYEELGGGVLWMQILCAAQTTRLDQGWNAGVALEQAPPAWDARGGARLSAEADPENALHPALPGVGGGEVFLPRRLQIEFELEREDEHRRRTHNLAPIEPGATEFQVARPGRLPPPGSFLLLGEEWMRLEGLEGNRARVSRAQRGTRAVRHPVQTPIQFGARVSREFDIPWATERWLR
jgi:prepilin-type N-terminal cleavage/methylation domain-containing protein